MPLPCMRVVQSITSAEPTSTFFGSQPRRAQVPPNGSESMMATSHPASRHLWATVEPAAPVPITMRSRFLPTRTRLQEVDDETRQDREHEYRERNGGADFPVRRPGNCKERWQIDGWAGDHQCHHRASWSAD